MTPFCSASMASVMSWARRPVSGTRGRAHGEVVVRALIVNQWSVRKFGPFARQSNARLPRNGRLQIFPDTNLRTPLSRSRWAKNLAPSRSAQNPPGLWASAGHHEFGREEVIAKSEWCLGCHPPHSEGQSPSPLPLKPYRIVSIDTCLRLVALAVGVIWLEPTEIFSCQSQLLRAQ